MEVKCCNCQRWTQEWTIVDFSLNGRISRDIDYWLEEDLEITECGYEPLYKCIVCIRTENLIEREYKKYLARQIEKGLDNLKTEVPDE